MFDPAADAWYVWIGLAVVSVTVAGVVLMLPTAAPAAATPVAEAIDRVAASPHQARSTIDLDATRMRLGTATVALGTDGGSASAPLTFAPVTPIESGRLGRVLSGARPSSVFGSTAAFAEAIDGAQTGQKEWRRAPERLTVRRVEWGGVNATLVG